MARKRRKSSPVSPRKKPKLKVQADDCAPTAPGVATSTRRETSRDPPGQSPTTPTRPDTLSTAAAISVPDDDDDDPLSVRSLQSSYKNAKRLADPTALLDGNTFNNMVRTFQVELGANDAFCFESDFWGLWKDEKIKSSSHSLPEGRDYLYLFLPVCENNHWFGMFIHKLEDGLVETFYLDSLRVSHFREVDSLLDLLETINYAPKGAMMNLQQAWKITRQSNPHDCGFILLAYVYKFLRDPAGFFEKLQGRKPQDIDASKQRAFIVARAAHEFDVRLLDRTQKLFLSGVSGKKNHTLHPSRQSTNYPRRHHCWHKKVPASTESSVRSCIQHCCGASRRCTGSTSRRGCQAGKPTVSYCIAWHK